MACDFEDALEMARALLSTNEGTDDLWEANDHVNDAIRARPADTEAWLLKCQIMSALEDDPSALAAAELAARKSPRSAEAHYWRGAILADMGRHGEALSAVCRAIATSGEDDDWLQEDLFYEKAAILDASGRRAEALATFEAGLARCPDSQILLAGIAPLRREVTRMTLHVLAGGRR